MQEQEARRDLVRQLATLGDQLQTLARGMEREDERRIGPQRLEDLQAVVAQLTDVANELAQYVDAGGGPTA